MTDNERLNNLFTRIREFEFPECETEDAKTIVMEIKAGFDIILDGMKKAAMKITHMEKDESL